MKVLYKPVGEPIRAIDIKPTLRSLQSLVEGNIEPVYLSADSVLICNDEGKINGMKRNFYLDAIDDMIFGPALFAGVDGEEFCDLSPECIEVITACFGKEASNVK